MKMLKKVPSEFSLTTDIVFNMKDSPKDLNNMYLYIDSKSCAINRYILEAGSFSI